MNLSAERAGTASSITHREIDCSAGVSFARFAGTLCFRRRGVVLSADFLEINCRLGHLVVHCLHRGDDDLGNSEIAEPFVVGGNDEPGSIIGVTSFEGILIGAEIVIPVLALGIVGFADLPSL